MSKDEEIHGAKVRKVSRGKCGIINWPLEKLYPLECEGKDEKGDEVAERKEEGSNGDTENVRLSPS